MKQSFNSCYNSFAGQITLFYLFDISWWSILIESVNAGEGHACWGWVVVVDAQLLIFFKR